MVSREVPAPRDGALGLPSSSLAVTVCDDQELSKAADLEQVGSLVVTAGGQIDLEDATWEFRGRLDRDFLDPEGDVLQLRQPART